MVCNVDKQVSCLRVIRDNGQLVTIVPLWQMSSHLRMHYESFVAVFVTMTYFKGSILYCVVLLMFCSPAQIGF